MTMGWVILVALIVAIAVCVAVGIGALATLIGLLCDVCADD